MTAVQDHYDRLSPLYRRFWGSHIHHGYWEGKEPVKAAQIKLIQKLIEWSGLRRGSRVLDVGCGIGGSSVWLAENWGCSVVGITLSPVQAEMARRYARRQGVARSVQIQVTDANHLNLAEESFDAVWVIECSEHLDEKARFIERCFKVLRPNGVLALCAWLDSSTSNPGKTLVSDVCEAMLCPALGRFEDYELWMKDAGFDPVRGRDIAPHVAQTWDICARLSQRPDVSLLVRALDKNSQRFVKAFPLMQKAFSSRAMGYGLFAAFKPQPPRSPVINPPA